MTDPLMRPEDFAAGFAQAVSGPVAKVKPAEPVVRDVLELIPASAMNKELPRDREMYYGNQTRCVAAYAARSTRHIVFHLTMSTCSVEIGDSKSYLTHEEVEFLCLQWCQDRYLESDFRNRKIGWWHKKAGMVIRVYEFGDYGLRDNEVTLGKKRGWDLRNELLRAIDDMKTLNAARNKEIAQL